MTTSQQVTATSTPSAGVIDRCPPAVVLNQRQRAFVRFMAAGLGQTEAARRAGYEPKNAKGQGHRLMRMPEVLAAIEAERAAVRDQHEISAASMINQADEDRREALGRGQVGAAVKATELKAKLAGLLVERRDVRTAGGFVIRIAGLDDA